MKYIVHLEASAYADIEVDAESIDKANQLALHKLQGIRWEVCDAEVFDTEPVNPPEDVCLCGRGGCSECKKPS